MKNQKTCQKENNPKNKSKTSKETLKMGNWIELDLNKSLEENAGLYFENAKKLKKKLSGAKSTLEKFQKKHSELSLNSSEKTNIPSIKESKKREWFEKFRWFLTSNNILVIAGRDSTTNEILIKKYTKENDLVFHTDMAGSPFAVIKLSGDEELGLPLQKKEELPEKILQEVADFTVSFSKAWTKGMSALEVFYVDPTQVTKNPNSGESLSKGAFVIRGKVNYLLGRMTLAVGIIKKTNNSTQEKLMVAPLQAIKANCKENFQLVLQGKKKPSEIAKLIKTKFSYDDLDEIIRMLPSGTLELKEPNKKD
ncbi:MAG TPA: NFACT RNA binding domain-containing protein [Candidatus Woesearchaeota archaeon]|nr:NFACT RNA binding domain-containing protein [Candidatus Woesearchaeota archaeon]